MKNCGQPGDEAEHAEGDGFGLDGVLGLGDVDGGVVKVVGEDGRDDALDLSLDGGHVAAALVELQVGERVVRAALEQPRLRAGVRMAVVGPLASISSCTTALLRTTVPTRVSFSCSAGGGGAPAVDSNWALV